jgi:hypothetical protein
MFDEPFLLERIEKAKKLAKSLIDGDFEDEESLKMLMRFRLSRELSKGYFDDYFDKRTLDDLVFELELIKLSSRPADSRGSDMLKESPKEAEALFDDWVEEDDKGIESTFEQDALKFMQSGDFKETEE